MMDNKKKERLSVKVGKYLDPLRRSERWHKMSKMSWFGVVRVIQGHWMEIAPFDRLHMSSICLHLFNWSA